MEKEYDELFESRDWKNAFDALPINMPKLIPVKPEDYPVVRVRATEYNKSNEKRRISISIDYKRNQVIATALKK